MCAKVVARYEESIAADECARLAEGDSTPRVRVAALRALAVVGESEHTPVVLAALGDEERAVADAAERALATIEQRLDRRFDGGSRVRGYWAATVEQDGFEGDVQRHRSAHGAAGADGVASACSCWNHFSVTAASGLMPIWRA